ncbi:MAG TPA: hypothetical protein V6D29_03440 [Leptolyngbyaceae cyanobacterium]
MEQTLKQLILWARLPMLGFLLSLAIVLLQSNRLDQNLRRKNISESEIEKQVEKARFSLDLASRLPSLGMSNILADWTFIRFLQYFGDDEVRAKTGYGLSPDYFKVIIERDPFFTDTYDYLFSSVSLYAAQPEVAISLTDQALESMSPTKPANSYLIWRNKAIDELLLLNDVNKAIASLKTSAEWAEQSPDQQAKQIAQRSLQFAEFLKTNPDSRIIRALAWSNVIVRAADDRSRQLAIKKVEEFGGQVTIENGAVKVFIPAQAQGK